MNSTLLTMTTELMTIFRSSSTSANPRGIPLAPFVDDVEDYVSSRDDVETTLRSFQEMISYVAHAPSVLLL